MYECRKKWQNMIYTGEIAMPPRGKQQKMQLQIYEGQMTPNGKFYAPSSYLIWELDWRSDFDHIIIRNLGPAWLADVCAAKI